LAKHRSTKKEILITKIVNKLY